MTSAPAATATSSSSAAAEETSAHIVRRPATKNSRDRVAQTKARPPARAVRRRTVRSAAWRPSESIHRPGRHRKVATSTPPQTSTATQSTPTDTWQCARADESDASRPHRPQPRSLSFRRVPRRDGRSSSSETQTPARGTRAGSSAQRGRVRQQENLRDRERWDQQQRDSCHLARLTLLLIKRNIAVGLAPQPEHSPGLPPQKKHRRGHYRRRGLQRQQPRARIYVHGHRSLLRGNQHTHTHHARERKRKETLH